MDEKIQIGAVVEEVARKVLPAGGPALDRALPLTELGLDSVGMVEMLAALEARLGLEIPAHEVTPENFVSLATIEELMERLLAAR